jgi:hypothetical protein
MFFTFDYTITFQAVILAIMDALDLEHRNNSLAVLKGASFHYYTMAFVFE